MTCPCGRDRPTIANRILLPGQSQTVGGLRIEVSGVPSKGGLLATRKVVKRLKQRVVRTLPADGEDDNDLEPWKGRTLSPDKDKDDDDLNPNLLNDRDALESAFAGLRAFKLQENDSSRVWVSSLNHEIRREIGSRLHLVERFSNGRN